MLRKLSNQDGAVQPCRVGAALASPVPRQTCLLACTSPTYYTAACIPEKSLPALPPHRCPPTLCTNQPFWICPNTRYICYIVAFFCRLYSVPSLPPTSNRAMPHCGMFVKVDKAIKMAPYGRAGSELPMPCTVPRLPGLIHCVQLLTLLLPLAQWSDYNKAPLCRLPVIIPSSPTCPSTSSSPSLHRIPSKPSERVRVQDLLTPTSARQLSLLLQIPFVIHVYCGLLA